MKRSVLVSDLDLSKDSTDLSQAVDIVEQLLSEKRVNMNFDSPSFIKFLLSTLTLRNRGETWKTDRSSLQRLFHTFGVYKKMVGRF